jgi:hypothetical protein
LSGRIQSQPHASKAPFALRALTQESALLAGLTCQHGQCRSLFQVHQFQFSEISWLTPSLTKNISVPKLSNSTNLHDICRKWPYLGAQIYCGTGPYHSVRFHFDPMTTYVSQDHKYRPSPAAHFLVPILVLRVTGTLSIVDHCTFCLLVDACTPRISSFLSHVGFNIVSRFITPRFGAECVQSSSTTSFPGTEDRQRVFHHLRSLPFQNAMSHCRASLRWQMPGPSEEEIEGALHIKSGCNFAFE